jgi:hypothetical protein
MHLVQQREVEKKWLKLLIACKKTWQAKAVTILSKNQREEI